MLHPRICCAPPITACGRAARCALEIQSLPEAIAFKLFGVVGSLQRGTPRVLDKGQLAVVARKVVYEIEVGLSVQMHEDTLPQFGDNAALAYSTAGPAATRTLRGVPEAFFEKGAHC